jgi:Holliday junction DNA helicase RuvA
MIGYLSGQIIQKKSTEVLVNAGGVGYLCRISLLTSENIGSAGEEVSLYIHTVVREDDISLYGFLTEKEKQIFIKIISISGIGPKTGLAVLSTFNGQDLFDVIAANRTDLLTKVPGIGGKTAERIMLDLKDKFKHATLHAENPTGIATASAKVSAAERLDEAVLALETLGFKRNKAQTVIQEISKHNPQAGIEEIVREALRRMGS